MENLGRDGFAAAEGWRGLGRRQKFSRPPVHKLFEGGVCLRGLEPLQLEIDARHVNEKIRRIHLALMSEGTATKFAGKPLSEPPFVMEEGLCSIRHAGSSVLVGPEPHDNLAEVVEGTLDSQSFATGRVPAAFGCQAVEATLVLRQSLSTRVSGQTDDARRSMCPT